MEADEWVTVYETVAAQWGPDPAHLMQATPMMVADSPGDVEVVAARLPGPKQRSSRRPPYNGPLQYRRRTLVALPGWPRQR